jgi:hypothetical protein
MRSLEQFGRGEAAKTQLHPLRLPFAQPYLQWGPSGHGACAAREEEARRPAVVANRRPHAPPEREVIVAAAGGLRRRGTWTRRGRRRRRPYDFAGAAHLGYAGACRPGSADAALSPLPTGGTTTPKYCRCSFPRRRSSLASERRMLTIINQNDYPCSCSNACSHATFG